MEPTTASPVSISLSELNIGPDWASQLGDQPAGQVIWSEVTPSGGGRRGPGRPSFRDGEGRGKGGARSGPRPAGPRPPGRRPEGRPPRGGKGGGFRREEERRYAPLAPGWHATVLPEPAGVENLTVQIKATGRAYPVFDLARLFLSSNDRFRVRFEPQPSHRTPPLILCAVDGSLWLTREEAKQHFLRSGLLGNFFSEEKVQVDPPKGVFTAIAVCGLSGTVLGPPNFHAYQRAIIRLHQERFKNMPLERYKSRIRIERDEELVKKWIESQSIQSRYTLLDGGDNPPVFNSAEDAARFLLETRESEIFAEAPSATVPGSLDESLLSPGLAAHFRAAIEQQKRFPLELVQELCRQFERHGLRFFKENKKETYVSRSRPRPLDPGLPVSDRVKAIVAYIREHTGCTYHDVLVALAPKSKAAAASEPNQPSPEPKADEPAAPEAAPAAPVAEERAEASAAAAEAATEAAEATSTPVETAAPNEGAATAEAVTTEAAASAEAAPAEAEAAEEPSEADREGIAILQDLRWLIREGYVTEFATGALRVVERQEKPIIVQPPKRLRLYGRAFTLWTRPYLPARFQPGMRLPGRAFTLWTKDIFVPPAPPPRLRKLEKKARPAKAPSEEAAAAVPAPATEAPAPAPVAPEAAAPAPESSPAPAPEATPETPASPPSA